MTNPIWIALAVLLVAGPAGAATDFIAPGTPATVGQGGSILGKEPEHTVPAPRGALQTFGLPGQDAGSQAGPRLSRTDTLERLKVAGYTDVVDLVQDSSGVWSARARKATRDVTVRCDGTGTITES